MQSQLLRPQMRDCQRGLWRLYFDVTPIRGAPKRDSYHERRFHMKPAPFVVFLLSVFPALSVPIYGQEPGAVVEQESALYDKQLLLKGRPPKPFLLTGTSMPLKMSYQG